MPSNRVITLLGNARTNSLRLRTPTRLTLVAKVHFSSKRWSTRRANTSGSAACVRCPQRSRLASCVRSCSAPSPLASSPSPSASAPAGSEEHRAAEPRGRWTSSTTVASTTDTRSPAGASRGSRSSSRLYTHRRVPPTGPRAQLRQPGRAGLYSVPPSPSA
ncbi:hypothetical protein T492DRAFT_1060215 [Pavlovales sp. CCMP2436]|nr:hypothetical protein T492DRAFT_1060215 [Pavlovales sp. CCMP2436]